MSKEEAPALTAHQRQINTAITFCEDRKWFILSSALRHCWGNGFLDVFRKYFKDNAELFRGRMLRLSSLISVQKLWLSACLSFSPAIHVLPTMSFVNMCTRNDIWHGPERAYARAARMLHRISQAI